MSWLFSQALVEEYSAGTFSDGEPSAQWNVMPTPQGFWRNDKMMDASRLSRFGPTLRLLTEDHGAAVLMSFLAAFPVRTSVSLETAKELTESDQASGHKWHASFAKYDRDSSSWKTHQLSLLGGLTEYSETWPRWGLMRDGECWPRQTLAPIIRETESGLLPTPCARDYRSPGKSRLERTGGKHGEPLNQVVGGLLNPTWVEWLMGWPIGWTALKPLAMDKYREWLQQHSPISQNNHKEIAC